MRNSAIVLILCLFATFLSAAETNDTIKTVAELSRAVFGLKETGRRFDIVATLTYARNRDVFFQDSTGGMLAIIPDDFPESGQLTIGDAIHLQGVVGFGRTRPTLTAARCTAINILSHGQQLTPMEITGQELQNPECNYVFTKVKGFVWDVIKDDIDPKFHFIIIWSQGILIQVSLENASDAMDVERAFPIDSYVEASGICDPTGGGGVRHNAKLIFTTSPADITLLSPARGDNFDVPPFQEARFLLASEMSALGRRRLSGHVLAVRQQNRLLLRSSSGLLHNIRLRTSHVPVFGDYVTIVGYPLSDGYHVNFTKAIWKYETGNRLVPESTPDTQATKIFRTSGDRQYYEYSFDGKQISVKGYMQNALSIEGDERLLLLESEGLLVKVDANSCGNRVTNIRQGSLVRVGGTCVMDIEPMRTDQTFPKVRGYTLVTRTPDDIQVLSVPSWWSTGRLLVAIGILLAALLTICVWNILLRRVSERRGKELAAEQLAHVESELKVYERTRLAVELHDALSQNLAGISFEIDTAERLSQTDAAETQRHLLIASHTLDSCRCELKNCLWDLRNNALEDADMDTAIRRTLAPCVGNESVSIRFNVPRERFTDATAHSILCIIRELTVNAIRHGKASAIHIAGSLEKNILRFSVKDNGCGFDPDHAVGPDDGHYGILGIRERLASFEGELIIKSTLGNGCKATVRIKIPEDELNNES